MRYLAILVATIAIGAFVLPASGQELPPAPPAGGDETVKPEPKVGDNPDTAADDLTEILQNMSPEELKQLIKKSTEMRLTGERQQVSAEIEASLTIKPELKDAARKVLEDNPANTQKDNIDRICRAFCKIDDRFSQAYDLYKGGKFAEAAEAFKKISNTKDANYSGAAKSYLLGDALLRAGLVDLGSADVAKNLAARKVIWEAIDTYRDMLENMPDRVSFSASAAINCAEAYDKLGRGIYAMEMYTFCIKNFALTLDKEQVEVIAEKVTKLTEMYKDPLKSCTKMMADVTDRLAKVDSGKATQEKQTEIIALLEDLIKTAEEKQQQQGSPSPSPSKGQKPGDQQGDEGKDGKDGTGKDGKTGKPGNPNGQPNKPAAVSALPSGSSGRTPRVTEVRGGDQEGDWAEMAPREREKLSEASKKVMSERYREIIQDYYKRLAEEKSR